LSKIEQLEAFLQQQPTDSFLQHALALEHIKLGNDEKAKTLFENLLQQNPNYVGSYYHLGKLLERQGNTAAAIAIYQTGMQHAKAAKDNHAHNELQAAKEDLEDY
jgi:tetratricopeptide (TPR) repeat protein